MLAAWLVFPLVLAAVTLGCGLLVEQVSGLSLPGALLVPTGLALVIVVSDFTTATAPTAQWTVPLVIACTVIGYGLGSTRIQRRASPWGIVTAVLAFAAYAAPIVASGRATFAGYVTLDDTSTWLALADRVLEHGRTVSGLAPSTYSVVLHDYLSVGYPLGGFLPLGIGGELTRVDIAWLFQPTIAFYGAVLALAIYSASGRLVTSTSLRAFVAFAGCQPALLFAYAFWSGIKEVVAAALVATLAATLAATMRGWGSVRSYVPVALVAASIIAVLGLPGTVWLALPAVVVVTLLLRSGLLSAGRNVAILVGLCVALSVPSLVTAQAFLSGAAGGEITQSTEVANLGHPLRLLQIVGVWPATDFRSQPADLLATYVLIGTVLLSGALALVFAWRRRAAALLLYLLAAVVGAASIAALERIGLGSPWLTAKGFATASPAFVALGAAGAAVIFESGRRVEATVIGAAVLGSVLWSNALTYRGVWLAPRDQLAELGQIGRRFSGEGPTLMTDPAPYGPRHFLRSMDPEGAAERRARTIPLLAGGTLAKGSYADLDAFALEGLLAYRTIVLRRSPVESRPPSAYRLVWRGRWWEVWQRSMAVSSITAHLGLGSESSASVQPACATVRRLAPQARGTGRLVGAVARQTPLVINLETSQRTADWLPTGYIAGSVIPTGPGSLTAEITLPRSGKYTVWLGGSYRDRLLLTIDGRQLLSSAENINPGSLYTSLVDNVPLAKGSHALELSYRDSPLRPGYGGQALPMGPLALSITGEHDSLRYVEPTGASALCGRRLDWIEAVTR